MIIHVFYCMCAYCWYIKNRILYVFFWVFPRRQIVICRRFGTLCQFHLQRLGVEYSTPGKYPKEYIQYSKHGESLKSRKIKLLIYIELDNLLQLYIVTIIVKHTESRSMNTVALYYYIKNVVTVA
jgi:hypothetical protein